MSNLDEIMIGSTFKVTVTIKNVAKDNKERTISSLFIKIFSHTYDDTTFFTVDKHDMVKGEGLKTIVLKPQEGRYTVVFKTVSKKKS